MDGSHQLLLYDNTLITRSVHQVPNSIWGGSISLPSRDADSIRLAASLRQATGKIKSGDGSAVLTRTIKAGGKVGLIVCDLNSSSSSCNKNLRQVAQ
jgi:hypothetical protein